MLNIEAVIDPETLLTLKLPEALTRIEEEAFEGGGFQAVVIPDGCKSVGTGAFRDCTELIYVSYPAGIVFEEGAFDGCHILR